MFLTTQYLEEADALADRVGIIDRGTIVAEGTPAQLKTALVARPSRCSRPTHQIEEFIDTLERFGPLSRGPGRACDRTTAWRGGTARRLRPRA